MIDFIFTEKTKIEFSNLENDTKKRIISKLKSLKNHSNIFYILKALKFMEPATHRLRVGQYRLILELIYNDNEDYKFRIIKIGHRRDIYA